MASSCCWPQRFVLALTFLLATSWSGCIRLVGAIAPPASKIHPSATNLPPHLLQVSGGSSPYESNPNYQETVGDLEARYRLDRHTQHQRGTFDTAASPYAPSSRHSPKPITLAIKDFFTSLHRQSPTLYFGLLSILSTFILWQIPSLQDMMQRHFVCSPRNIKRKRYHTLLTSAISHVSPMHLLINSYALLTFGPSVRNSIASFGLPLWPFALGSALTGSLFYLLLTRDGRGSLGLSAVTVGMMAFFARTYPNAQLGFVVGFIPIRLPAEYALLAIGIVSLFGSIVRGLRDGVAHSAHLGGLVFGVIYFELLIRGYLSKIGRRGR